MKLKGLLKVALVLLAVSSLFVACDTIAGGKWPVMFEPFEPEEGYIYLKPNENWLQNDGSDVAPRFAVYTSPKDWSSADWYDMEETEKDSGIYKVKLPADKNYYNIIFCRMNGSKTENNWDNKYNQSKDEVLVYADDDASNDNKVLYIVADGSWDKSSDSFWHNPEEYVNSSSNSDKNNEGNSSGNNEGNSSGNNESNSGGNNESNSEQVATSMIEEVNYIISNHGKVELVKSGNIATATITIKETSAWDDAGASVLAFGVVSDDSWTIKYTGATISELGKEYNLEKNGSSNNKFTNVRAGEEYKITVDCTNKTVKLERTKSVEGSGEEIVVEKRTIYLYPTSTWAQKENDDDQWDERFIAYVFEGVEAEHIAMEKESGSGGTEIWVCEIPVAAKNIIFIRKQESDLANDWTNVWGQTEDLTLPSDKTKFTIGNEKDGKFTGEWS